MPDIITIDLRDIDKFERHLEAFNKRALPIANRTALTAGAFDASREAKKNLDKGMILRNTWTKRSIQVEKARGNVIRNQEAVVGSTVDYLEEQEFGATKSAGGKQGIRMTTSYASGEGMQARPRRKVARGANKIRRINLSKSKKKGVNKKQQAIIAIYEAKKAGRKYVFLSMPWTKGKKGIYKITGGKKRPKIKMVHSLKEQSVTVKRNPWLKPAVDRTRRHMPSHWLSALTFQVNRMRLFRDF